MSSVIYLHGLASSPQSAKAVYFGDRFRNAGFSFIAPDLNQPDFFSFTLTRAINRTVELLDSILRSAPDESVILMGSSFGALTALHAAHKLHYPAALRALILLAPALDFMKNCEMTAADVQRWETEGKANICHNNQPLSFQFIQDVQRYDSYKLESPRAPTLLVHGRSDQTIPFEQSKRFADQHRSVEFHPVEARHELDNVFGALWSPLDFTGVIPSFMKKHKIN